MCVDSVSMEDRLPWEMLEAILGNLDRETLCTARLVSRTFCAAASANISSLTLRSPWQAVSLERFPRLGHVTLHHVGDGESLAELDARLRGVVTQLTLSQVTALGPITLPEVPGMPNLRVLDAEAVGHVDGAMALHTLTNLETLRVGKCTPSGVGAIMACTWLTSLGIGLVTWPGEGWESADFSWLQQATKLRKLQALRISASHKALPLIGNLTGLTGLTWLGDRRQVWRADRDCSVAPLSHLSRLRSLYIRPVISQSDLRIACSLRSGSLAKLRLRAEFDAPAGCGRFLTRQTALTQLRLGGGRLCNLRHMGALRVESLRSLELQWPHSADVGGLDALQNATGLTKLRLSTVFKPHCSPRAGGLSQAIGRLTQLCALNLEVQRLTPDLMELHMALSPLTALTELQLAMDWCDGDLRALLGLTRLRVLYLRDCNLADDVVSQLAVLTNLRSLRVSDCGVRSLAAVTDIINPLREAMGWPPVHARCDF